MRRRCRSWCSRLRRLQPPFTSCGKGGKAVDARRPKTVKRRMLHAARWIGYVAVLAVFAGPFWGMLSTAFSSATVKPGTLVLWPSEPSVQHFVYAFREGGAWRFLLNSCIVVTFGLILQVSVSALAAYALARKKFVGAAIVSLLILSTMMLP